MSHSLESSGNFQLAGYRAIININNIFFKRNSLAVHQIADLSSIYMV